MNLKDRILRVRLFLLKKQFPGSNLFWINEYKKGGNSGPGSYGDLANFKAKVLNQFVEQNAISTVIEFGCGDGNQLSLARYKSYIGFDIAPGAIELCVNKFSNDNSKSFILFQPEFFKLGGELRADLAISLDVIFHLVEQEKYELHLRQLFGSSNKWVIIYGIDSDAFFPEPYSKPRKFSSWVQENLNDWSLDIVIENEYPVGSGSSSSWADFYIFKRATAE
jgi:SAM-dependent methyltransferase